MTLGTLMGPPRTTTRFEPIARKRASGARIGEKA
jgi:hypothetical protein